MDDELKGLLIETGTFRIDRDRALAKLRDFQLADPGEFYLDLGRAASLSKPSYVRVDAKDRTLTLAFDGTPLSGKSMSDPFSPLFDDEAGGTERERCLAYALLGALRTEPELISIESGDEPTRALLHLTSLRHLERCDPGEDEKETILTIRWKSGDHAARVVSAAPRDFGLIDARLIVENRDLGERPLAKEAAKLGNPPHKKWSVYALPVGDGHCGLIFPYRHGVRAGRSISSGAYTRRELSVFADSKDFELDLSRKSVSGRNDIRNLAKPLLTQANKRYPWRPLYKPFRLALVVGFMLLLSWFMALPGGGDPWRTDHWVDFAEAFAVSLAFPLLTIPFYVRWTRFPKAKTANTRRSSRRAGK